MKISIRFKISSLIILLISLLMVTISTITLRDQSIILKEEMRKAAEAIARNLSANAKESLLLERYLDLDSLVFEAQKNIGVQFIAITDKNNVIRAHTNINLRNKEYKSPQNIRINEKDNSLEYFDKDKNLNYYLSFLIKKKGKLLGTVYLGYSQQHILIALEKAKKKMIIFTISSILFGILGALLLSSYISKPIKLLAEGTKEIANENFEYRIPIKTNDEIGDLTIAFNQMANDLQHKELIKSAFKRYVSSQVLDQIIADPDFLKKLGGERKILTVLFSDIRGFTPLSEALAPEEVITLLNDYLDGMTEIIFFNNGIIDKFIGDAIMAVWGALQVNMTPAEQAYYAVKAAVEMQKKLTELQVKWTSLGRKTINVGIGINTGAVVVGNIGSTQRIEYTVIGDNVNIAARMEENAKPGQTLISDTTYNLIKYYVEANKLAPMKVKGKSKLLHVYEVLEFKSEFEQEKI